MSTLRPGNEDRAFEDDDVQPELDRGIVDRLSAYAPDEHEASADTVDAEPGLTGSLTENRDRAVEEGQAAEAAMTEAESNEPGRRSPPRARTSSSPPRRITPSSCIRGGRGLFRGRDARGPGRTGVRASGRGARVGDGRDPRDRGALSRSDVVARGRGAPGIRSPALRARARRSRREEGERSQGEARLQGARSRRGSSGSRSARRRSRRRRS